jgi:hypothetical protein
MRFMTRPGGGASPASTLTVDRFDGQSLGGNDRA